MRKYQQYTATDFLADESFYNWVIKKDTGASLFWDGWLAANPHKKEEIEKARDYVLQLKAKETVFSKADVDGVWSKISESIDQQEHGEVPVRKMRRWQPSQMVAASFVGLLLFGSATIYSVHQFFPVVVDTRSAGRRTVDLPDGSSVVLNANSTLSYKRFWFLGGREVDLKGEAFFEVQHTENNRPFTVRFNTLRLQVLGTAFNISEHDNSAKVVLARGKVNLHVNDSTAVMMKPGALVDIRNIKRSEYVNSMVDASVYAAWKDGQMIFTETPLKEIVERLELSYGYTVTVKDSLIWQRKLTTKVENDNVDLLLELMRESLQVTIEKKGKAITISPAKNSR